MEFVAIRSMEFVAIRYMEFVAIRSMEFVAIRSLQTSSWLACANNSTSMAFSKERCPDDKGL